MVLPKFANFKNIYNNSNSYIADNTVNYILYSLITCQTLGN